MANKSTISSSASLSVQHSHAGELECFLPVLPPLIAPLPRPPRVWTPAPSLIAILFAFAVTCMLFSIAQIPLDGVLP
jgi:hypothetical protein